MNTICNRLFKNIVAATVLLTVSLSAQSSLIVGNEAIERTYADGWSNFVVGLTSEIFNQDAIVKSWEVFTHNEGTLGLLLLRGIGGDDYKIIGTDFEVVNAGLNVFDFNPDSGSDFVRAGDILGLYIGTAKVAYEHGLGDSVGWCAGGVCFNPTVGDIVTIAGNDRTYSANVTAVTAPATALILSLGLLAMSLRSRRTV